LLSTGLFGGDLGAFLKSESPSMDDFRLRDGVIQDDADYVRSFVHDRDRRIDEFVQKSLRDAVTWPQPRIRGRAGSTEPGDPRSDRWPTPSRSASPSRALRESGSSPGGSRDGAGAKLWGDRG